MQSNVHFRFMSLRFTYIPIQGWPPAAIVEHLFLPQFDARTDHCYNESLHVFVSPYVIRLHVFVFDFYLNHVAPIYSFDLIDSTGTNTYGTF